MAKEVVKIADFLQIAKMSESDVERVVERTSMNGMRERYKRMWDAMKTDASEVSDEARETFAG